MRPRTEKPLAAISIDHQGDHARMVPTGLFDLTNVASVVRAVQDLQPSLTQFRSVEVDLARVDRIDGAGAVLLARLLDQLDVSGHSTRLLEQSNPEAARLIALYRGRQSAPAPHASPTSGLARIGAGALQLPAALSKALDFTGRCAVAVPKAVAAPRSVDWQSLPKLLQDIGADGLVVTGAANLLVGLIIGLLGVSQLGRFGAIAFVPELVVVAQFRELGPLVTAIVVAGRSGAGLASELATMKVSEEVTTAYVHSTLDAVDPEVTK